MTTLNQEPTANAISPPTPRPLGAGGTRISSLDGIRAVSIIMVVGAHALNASVRQKTGQDYDGIWSYLFNGGLGVATFFVISGFLITHLLLKEIAKSGTVNLPHFYLRRTFRIWPAFYVYLAVITLLHLLKVLVVTPRNMIAAGLFVFNYVPDTGIWWVGHSWSLSVEEQFYLLWPLGLLAAGRNRAIFVAGAMILLVPMIRFAEAQWLPHTNFFFVRIWEMAHTRLDTLMFGCWAALAFEKQWFRPFIARCLKFQLAWIALILLLIGGPLIHRFASSSIAWALVYSVESGAVLVLILAAVIYPDHWSARWLNTRPIVHLGRISYSLYLWQQLVLVHMKGTWSPQFPLNIVAAIILAELSCFLVEKPFLKLRELSEPLWPK